MVEQHREAGEERAADLVAVFGAPAHAAHETVRALGGDAPRGRLGRQAACDLVAEENFRPLEKEVRPCLDDLARNRGRGHPADAVLQEYAGRGREHTVEDPPVETDKLRWRQTADAHLRQLFLDLPAQIGAQLHSRLHREEQAEVAHRDTVQGIEPAGSGAQIVCGPPRRGLHQRIGPDLEVEVSIERGIDQRICKGDELQHRAFGEVDIEQPKQRLLDMGEHVGGGNELPGLAPAIVDAQERLFLLDPGQHWQEVGIGIARHRRAQALVAEAAPGIPRAHGRLSGSRVPRRAPVAGSAVPAGSLSRVVRSTGGAGIRPPGSTR